EAPDCTRPPPSRGLTLGAGSTSHPRPAGCRSPRASQSCVGTPRLPPSRLREGSGVGLFSDGPSKPTPLRLAATAPRQVSLPSRSREGALSHGSGMSPGSVKRSKFWSDIGSSPYGTKREPSPYAESAHVGKRFL